MHVIDLEGNEYPLQATTTWNGELNGNQNLSLTIIPSKVNRLFIEDIAEMWVVVDDDGTEYKIIYCKRKGKGNLLTVEVKAEPLFFNDFDTQRVYERHDRHMTANAYFHVVFDGSDYNFILNGTFEAVQWEGAGEGATRLDMFKNGLNRYRAEFRISGNTIYIENQIGRDTSIRYQYMLNASNIVQEIDASEFYTYAKGYGDYGDGEGGEDWQNAKLIREYTSPIAKIPSIGIREAPPIKNGNITTRETMDEQLRILVDESLKISASATIHDTRRGIYSIAQPELGDRVFLIDMRIGLTEEIRVSSISITKDYKGNVLKLDLTFGEIGITKRYQSNLDAATKNITALLEGRLKLPFSVLDNAVAEATKALTRMQSELTISDNGSLVAVDKTNPNNVVVLNAAGLGVSDDGGATFQNAITGQGINGRAIIAKTVLADVIAGGILTSLNGNFELNMNTGEMYSQNADWTLGNGANINFTNSNNRITYRYTSGITRSSGMGVGLALGGEYPYSFLGTTGASDLDTLSQWFSGFIANTTARIAEGGANSINGNRLEIRNQAVGYNKGFTIDLFGSRPSLVPMYGAANNYDLGNTDNLFDRLHVRQLRTVGSFEIRNNAVTDIGWRLSTIQESGRVALRGLNMGDYLYDLGSSESYNRFYYGYISHLRPSALDDGSGVGSSDLPYRYGHIRSLTVHENFYNNSLREYKENIEDLPLEVAIDFVKHNQIKTFNYINSEEKSVGLIRDEVVIADQSLVGTDTAIAPTNIQFINQKVLQNLLERVEALENGTEPTDESTE